MDSSRSLHQKWHRFRQLSFREIRWRGLAWLALPVVRLLIRVVGYQKAVNWLDDPTASDPRLTSDEVVLLARAVRSAASNHFLTLNCLPQSLWICNRLSSYGVPHALRLGVKSVDSSGLLAHAWVEAGGRKLNEPDDPAGQATPFHGVQADESR
jgi:hypothetical protein